MPNTGIAETRWATADALEEFNRQLPDVMAAMGEDDVLMICADHGNDPTAPGTDHTREYVPRSFGASPANRALI